MTRTYMGDILSGAGDGPQVFQALCHTRYTSLSFCTLSCSQSGFGSCYHVSFRFLFVLSFPLHPLLLLFILVLVPHSRSYDLPRLPSSDLYILLLLSILVPVLVLALAPAFYSVFLVLPVTNVFFFCVLEKK